MPRRVVVERTETFDVLVCTAGCSWVKSIAGEDVDVEDLVLEHAQTCSRPRVLRTSGTEESLTVERAGDDTPPSELEGMQRGEI